MNIIKRRNIGPAKAGPTGPSTPPLLHAHTVLVFIHMLFDLQYVHNSYTQILNICLHIAMPSRGRGGGNGQFTVITNYDVIGVEK